MSLTSPVAAGVRAGDLLIQHSQSRHCHGVTMSLQVARVKRGWMVVSRIRSVHTAGAIMHLGCSRASFA